MKPAPKYQAAMVLYHLGEQAVWEHQLFGLLRQNYPARDLSGLREDLIGLSTVGWLTTEALAEHSGQIIRRYRLAATARPLIEYQLNLNQYLPTDLNTILATGGNS